MKGTRINKSPPPAGAATGTPHQEQAARNLAVCSRRRQPRAQPWARPSQELPAPPVTGPAQGRSHSCPRRPWSSSGLPCLPGAACSASRTPPWPPGPPPGRGPGTGLWFLSLWPPLQRGPALPRSEQRCSSLLPAATRNGTGKGYKQVQKQRGRAHHV